MESPIAANSLAMGSLPARHARYRPRHTAVVIASREEHDREIRLTWREFDAYVNRWANALASLGVRRGDRIATVLANSLELLATYWSCAKLGATIVPTSPLLTATGLAALDALRSMDETRAVCRRAQWVLTDADPRDEAAGFHAFGTLIGNASDARP